MEQDEPKLEQAPKVIDPEGGIEMKTEAVPEQRVPSEPEMVGHPPAPTEEIRTGAGAGKGTGQGRGRARK